MGLNKVEKTLITLLVSMILGVLVSCVTMLVPITSEEGYRCPECDVVQTPAKISRYGLPLTAGTTIEGGRTFSHNSDITIAVDWINFIINAVIWSCFIFAMIIVLPYAHKTVVSSK